LLMITVLLSTFLAPRLAAAADNSPNILIAISDDQSCWHTSFNGDAAVVTPGHLCELAFGKRPAEELYDMRADPWQMNNLAASPGHQGQKQTMHRMLTTLLRETGDRRFTDQPVRFESYPRYTREWKAAPENQEAWRRYRDIMWTYIRNCRR